MTEPNQPNNDQGWNPPPSQPGAWDQPAQSGQWNQPQGDQGQGQYQPPAQSGQYQPPAQPGQYQQPGGYPPAGGYPPPGQPGQFGAPGAYGVPGYPPPAPPKRRTGRILAIVGAAVVVIIVAAVVIATLVNKHSDKLAKEHTLAVPSKAGSWVLLTSDSANKVGDNIATAVKEQDTVGVWTNPKVGVYGKSASSDPEVILLGLNVADSKELTREMGTNSIEDESKEILKSAGLSDAQSYPAGTFGGVLKCGTLDEGTDKLATCIWVDHSTVGVVYQIGGTADTAATAAKEIREAGEK